MPKRHLLFFFLLRIAATVMLLLTLPVSVLPQKLSAQTKPNANVHRRTTDQLIVKFADNDASAPLTVELVKRQVTLLSNAAGVALKDVGEGLDGVRVLKLQQVLDASQLTILLQTLRDNATALGIQSLELDEIRYASLAPNDASYSQQWDMQPASSGSYGVNAPAAWDVTTGSANYVVAVVDTGIRLNHPELAGRTTQGYDFVLDAQVGNDGNGRDSDPSDPGDWITAAESAAGYFVGCSPSASSS